MLGNISSREKRKSCTANRHLRSSGERMEYKGEQGQTHDASIGAAAVAHLRMKQH